MADRLEKEASRFDADKFELVSDLRGDVEQGGAFPLPVVGLRDVAAELLQERSAKWVFRVLGHEGQAS
jgi:hypothetical protein